MRTLIAVGVMTLGAAAVQAQSTDEAKALAREYIKDHLKAPATAVFSRWLVAASSLAWEDSLSNIGVLPFEGAGGY